MISFMISVVPPKVTWMTVGLAIYPDMHEKSVISTPSPHNLQPDNTGTGPS